MPQIEKDTIVVVGVGALSPPHNIKKNAPTIVNSITATDIGAFPDKSASGALAARPRHHREPAAVDRRQHPSSGEPPAC